MRPPFPPSIREACRVRVGGPPVLHISGRTSVPSITLILLIIALMVARAGCECPTVVRHSSRGRSTRAARPPCTRGGPRLTCITRRLPTIPPPLSDTLPVGVFGPCAMFAEILCMRTLCCASRSVCTKILVRTGVTLAVLGLAQAGSGRVSSSFHANDR